jgi:hypothetical protein
MSADERARDAHLADLQHQVSTKSLALQTLNQEHKNLLSAFARTRSRSEALEKKHQVSDVEIMQLTEERQNLSEKCRMYENQIEDLTARKAEADKQSIAGGGQYASILQQAAELERRTLMDKSRWKQEKVDWEAEKVTLTAQVKDLNEKLQVLEKQLEEIASEAKDAAAKRLSVERSSDLVAGRIEIDNPTTTLYSASLDPGSAFASSSSFPARKFASSRPPSRPSSRAKQSIERPQDMDIDIEDAEYHVKDTDILYSDDVQKLRNEIRRLQAVCTDASISLRIANAENAKIGQAFTEISELGNRLVKTADQYGTIFRDVTQNTKVRRNVSHENPTDVKDSVWNSLVYGRRPTFEHPSASEGGPKKSVASSVSSVYQSPAPLPQRQPEALQQNPPSVPPIALVARRPGELSFEEWAEKIRAEGEGTFGRAPGPPGSASERSAGHVAEPGKATQGEQLREKKNREARDGVWAATSRNRESGDRRPSGKESNHPARIPISGTDSGQIDPWGTDVSDVWLGQEYIHESSALHPGGPDERASPIPTTERNQGVSSTTLSREAAISSESRDWKDTGPAIGRNQGDRDMESTDAILRYGGSQSATDDGESLTEARKGKRKEGEMS